MTLSNYKDLNEQVYKGTLPNGLNVFVIPKPGFHKKYAFFATDYGGVDRRFKLADKWIDTPAGVAHFLEHKLFDTKDGNALEKLSENGASPNAYTGFDVTAYHFECIDKFSENLEILIDFVSTPYFTPESVEKEQGIIAQEILMYKDNPDFCLYYGLLESLFKSNPIRDDIAGTVESIANITADTLYDCHSAFYAPSNMALCVVGDVDHSMVFDTAQRILPDTLSEVPLRDYGAPELLSPEVAKLESSMEVSLPIFLGGCKLSPVTSGSNILLSEMVNALSLEVLCGNSSPLYMKLYAEGLINADFSASYNSVAGIAYMAFGGEAREPHKVYDEVIKEIQRISINGPDNGLFERIKKSAIGSHIRALNSFGAIASSIVEGHFRGYDPLEATELLSKISVDDILNYMRNNFVPENMAISIINPKNEVNQ